MSTIGLAPTGAANQSVFMGRKKIMTNYLSKSQIKDNMIGYEIITKDNICEALNLAMGVHRENSREIEYLVNYFKGYQNILDRVKEIRTDVDNKVVINNASAFTRNIIGYTFGKPIQYAYRGDDNEGVEEIKKEIKTLNDYSMLNDKETSDISKATISSICGISHRAIFANSGEDEDEAPYYYLDLDSKNTFVAYNSQLGGEESFACTYIQTFKTDGQIDYTLYTVYTRDEIYLFKSPTRSEYVINPGDLVPGYPKKNPLGIIPIVENENNQFRMGHWETAITLMDAINKLASDSVNDVEQFVNAILVAVNAELTDDVMDEIQQNKFASIKSPLGLPADLKYIQAQLDGSSTEQLRQYLESCLRSVVGVPDRKTKGNGGGDTGDAVKFRDGWSDIEVVAKNTEKFNKKSEKKELKIILKILRDLKKIHKTTMINIDVKYPRNKTDNLNSKVTSMASMINTRTLAPVDILDIVDITSDNAEVIERGENYWANKKEEELEDQRKQLEMQSKVQGADEGTQKGGNVNATDRIKHSQPGNKPGKPANK